MEAIIRARRAAVFFSLLIIALPGCNSFMPAKTAPTPPPKADAEVPQVVKGDAAKPKSEPEMDAVQQWASQMKQHESPPPRPRPVAVSATQLQPANEDASQAKTAAAPVRTTIEPSSLTGATANVPIAEDQPVAPAAAPTLRAVEVHPVGAPESISAHRPARPDSRGGATPAANSPAASSNEDVAIQELLHRWLSQPGGDSFQEQLDRRVLSALNGDFEAARSPLEAVTSEQQRVASQFIETMISLRDAHGGDMSAAVARVLPHVNEMRESLTPLADLTAPVFVLCRAVRGFGQYEALSSTTLPAGKANEFVTYLQVSNFASRKADDGQYESQFNLRTQVLTRSGETVLEYKDEAIIDRCRTRRQDCFIPRLVQLPAVLGPGDYVVKVTIADKIGQKVTEARTTFKLAVRT